METKPNENSPLGTTQNLVTELKEYVELRVDKAKLSATEHLTVTISSCYGVLLATFLGIVALIFFSLALLFALGQVIGYSWAAVIVGGVYLIIAVICYLLRAKLLEKPLLKMFLKMFFNGDSKNK